MTLNRLAVIAPGFTAPSPAQQILDRLLAGFPRDGAFRPRLAPAIAAFAPGGSTDELQRRARDLALEVTPDLATALHGADAAVVAWPGPGHAADAALLRLVLEQLRPRSACFVLGLIATHREDAVTLLDLAASRRIHLTSGTAVTTAFRLPDVRVPGGSRAVESLIVVQGPDHDALLDAVEGLQPDLERGRVLFDLPMVIRRHRGDAVWAAGQRREWARDLLAAALSRSDNPQGDPVRDGRTQDLLGLGLVPKLATNPRAWITEHPDGSRSAILALDGVVTDINFAVRLRNDRIVSAQLFRLPAPNQAHFHGLAAAIEDFLRGASRAWTDRRALSTATWHAALRGESPVRR